MRDLFRAAGVAAVCLAMSGGAAGAVATSCDNFSPDVTSLVTPSAGCQIQLSVDNDSPREDFLAANWFGSTDWIFSAKTNEDSPGGIEEIDELGDSGLNDLGLSIEGTLLEGEWTLDGQVPGAVMLVFKGGTPKLPNALVAYLLAGDSGSYTSPFFTTIEDAPDSPSEISHISAWVLEDDAVGVEPIPLPAAAPMLLGGLALLGLLARRRG